MPPNLGSRADAFAAFALTGDGSAFLPPEEQPLF